MKGSSPQKSRGKGGGTRSRMSLELVKFVEILLAGADRTEVVEACEATDTSQAPAVRE